MLKYNMARNIPVSVDYGENVAPQPHIEFAFGLLNTKRDPIMSSFQSISVPSRYNIERLHVHSVTSGDNIWGSASLGQTVGSSTYSKP